MKNKLVWRLGKLPSTEELRELVKDKIITQEEAREILFSSETEEDRDKKSLESEIKFLRELVEKLSEGRTEIIEKIRYIEKPYHRYPWWSGYEVWCGTSINSGTITGNGSMTLCANGTNDTYTSASSNFSDIKTF